jgi:hypothetical protein
MGKGCFPLAGDKFQLLRRAVSAGLLTGMITVAGCATYPGLSGITEQSTAYDTALEASAAPAASADPERASAVAEIRAKAEAATTDNSRTSPNVFHSYGPSGASVMTRAERLAVEAELDAVLAAQAQTNNPADVERLKARAAYLKRLAGQHRAQAEADIQAASQSAN